MGFEHLELCTRDVRREKMEISNKLTVTEEIVYIHTFNDQSALILCDGVLGLDPREPSVDDIGNLVTLNGEQSPSRVRVCGSGNPSGGGGHVIM